MLDELTVALGAGNKVTEPRLEKIENALRPIFSSLPKNEYGNLENAGVRYALHRLFVLRHGMYVKGLEPQAMAWNESMSPTYILDDRVPAYVVSLFEKRLSGRGLGMHEIAILAATLEHLIHDEAQFRLTTAYNVRGFSVDAYLSSEELEAVVDTYMVIFLMGKDVANTTHAAIKRDEIAIAEVYPQWPQSQKFTRDVQRSVIAVAGSSPHFSNGMFSFTAALQIVEEIGDKFGSWQDYECRDLKAALVKLEDPGTGRVPLKRFYSGALGGGGQWQFTESVAYLRELGALDETAFHQHKSVMIPNYIYAPSNCLISSSLYSLCCHNECETLLGHLEREIAEPDATPARIIDIVRYLPSATEKAPRAISAELRGRLEEVASHHGGRVPLHGRLFGQWMHQAYPRECAFPHKAGTIKPKNVYEWAEVNGVASLSASREEIQRYTSEDVAGGRTVMWTAEEEELVMPTTAPPSGRGAWGRCGATLAALAALCLALWRSLGPVLATGAGAKCTLPMTEKSHFC